MRTVEGFLLDLLSSTEDLINFLRAMVAVNAGFDGEDRVFLASLGEERTRRDESGDVVHFSPIQDSGNVVIDTVRDAHDAGPECIQVATDHGGRDAWLERGAEERTCAAAGNADHADAFRVEVGTGLDPIDHADDVPHAPSDHGLSEKQRRTGNRLAGLLVEALGFVFRIAAASESQRLYRERGHPVFHHLKRKVVFVENALGAILSLGIDADDVVNAAAVTRNADDGRRRLLCGVREQEVREDGHAGAALDNKLFAPITGKFARLERDGIERRLLLRKAAQEFDDLGRELFLPGFRLFAGTGLKSQFEGRGVVESERVADGIEIVDFDLVFKSIKRTFVRIWSIGSGFGRLNRSKHGGTCDGLTESAAGSFHGNHFMSADPNGTMGVMRSRVAVAALVFVAFSACSKKHVAPVPPPSAAGRGQTRTQAPAPPAGATERGIASWYGVPYHGRPAADGEIYDMEKLVAAHKTLPFQTMVRVRNLTNDKTVDVRIIDRGPFVANRIIDLSHAAANAIGMVGPGVAQVELTILSSPAGAAAQGWFGVQVGAFRDKANADRMVKNMTDAYGSAKEVVRQGDPPLWRVLAGREATTDAAEALAQRVRKEQNVAGAFVVRLD